MASLDKLYCPHCLTAIENEKARVCIVCKRGIAMHILAKRNPALMLLYAGLFCLFSMGVPIIGWISFPVMLPLVIFFLLASVIAFAIQILEKIIKNFK